MKEVAPLASGQTPSTRAILPVRRSTLPCSLNQMPRLRRPAWTVHQTPFPLSDVQARLCNSPRASARSLTANRMPRLRRPAWTVRQTPFSLSDMQARLCNSPRGSARSLTAICWASIESRGVSPRLTTRRRRRWRRSTCTGLKEWSTWCARKTRSCGHQLAHATPTNAPGRLCLQTAPHDHLFEACKGHIVCPRPFLERLSPARGVAVSNTRWSLC